ncbi:DNA-3-methyladenine glycosylase family protein [Haliangium ochraceum]|nr:DNA-3-methyladenine glycosylase 2 family protein [Haliangium ochraceum]
MSRAPASAQPVLDIAASLVHLRGTGAHMPALIAVHGPPDLARTRNSFASLGRAIVYQQLATRAAAAIYARFLALFPRGRFPTPAALLAVSEDTLRSAGLSRAKATALRDLAAKFADGSVRSRQFSRMDADELRATLTQVRGIGPWSVDMFLIFGLMRPDVLPVGDLGVRKGMQRYFELEELPKPAEMQELAAPWAPFRSVASWYMWRVAENGIPGR